MKGEQRKVVGLFSFLGVFVLLSLIFVAGATKGDIDE
jgi:hypothetical protein